jgi:hypothetical protein
MHFGKGVDGISITMASASLSSTGTTWFYFYGNNPVKDVDSWNGKSE